MIAGRCRLGHRQTYTLTPGRQIPSENALSEITLSRIAGCRRRYSEEEVRYKEEYNLTPATEGVKTMKVTFWLYL